MQRLEGRDVPSAANYHPPSYFTYNQALTAQKSSTAVPLDVADDIAFGYLNQHAADFHAVPEDFVGAKITSQYSDADTGLTHIYLRQMVYGLEVQNADMNISITADGHVLSAGGGFVSGLSAKLGPATATPSRSAGNAVLMASQSLGVPIDPRTFSITAGSDLTHQSMAHAPGLSLADIPVHLHYVPTADGSAVLAWNMIIQTTDTCHWYDMSIGDGSGAIVWQNDWVFQGSYEAIPLSNGSPVDGGFVLLSNPANATASPYGWHDTDGKAGAEFTSTRGNNVDVHMDTNANNVPDGEEGAGTGRPDGGASLNFSGYTFDTVNGPTTLPNQAIAQINLFYVNNIAHDIHYQYGFTEAAGNFQVNNYGNGGSGGDAVQADAQDGAANAAVLSGDGQNRNNANFATPPDGTAPRMQMYITTYTSPGRDTDLDNAIILHEYGHGVSSRLTGGPANANALDALQSGGMGEGWSDFFALMFQQRPGDSQNDPLGFGTYINGDLRSGGGWRQYRSSYSMTTNPTTFADFELSTEVHDAGEIWAATLWDLNWNLINKYGYDANLYTGWSASASVGTPARAGNKLVLRLVLDAMKLQPANPSFIQARDAILAADSFLNGGADHDEIWAAFARRGLGRYAISGSSASSSVITDFTTLSNTVYVVNDSSKGSGSLRAAIDSANKNPGTDTLIFEPTVFNTPRIVHMQTGEIQINEAVTIPGPGAGLLTLDGYWVGRIFNTDGAPAGASIKITGLTLADGRAANGAAINVTDEALTIEDCVISGNSASDDGGAINIQSGGSLTLLRTTISGNTAADDGGGIYFNAGGSADIRDCAIVNNTASTGSGGGLCFYGTVGSGGLSVLSSTIAGNIAAVGGGGIALIQITGPLGIANSTIFANTSTGYIGGGISRLSGSGQINLTSSVVSGNSGSNPEISSDGAVNATYSAIGSTVGFNLSGSKNLVGQNLKLRPLANNGGPTLTVAFDSDSPLRGAGLSSPFSSTDQRGFPRNNNGVDIGAFELQTTVVNANSSGTGSLLEAVAESNRVVGTDTIDFSSTFNTPQGISIVPQLGELVLTDAVTIQGTGASLITISGLGLSRIFNTTGVAAGKTVTLSGLTLTSGYNVAGGINSGFGGAVWADDEILVVDNCAITNSFATIGGAIFVGANGKLSLTQSTLSNNFAVGVGGAIRLINGGGSEIIASSLIGNTAAVGGAIYLSGQNSGVTVLNSTLSGNSATNGGGIALDTFVNGALTIRNTTITGNAAGTRGGGLDSLNGSPNIHIESTIVSGNTAVTGPDISSTSTITVNKSAIGSAAGFTLTGSNNLAFGTNLKLGALAQNGGPTQTHLPAGDSPLVNAGSNPATVTYDQRGIARTLLGGTDIGSVELTSVPDTTAPTITLITSPSTNKSYSAGEAITIEVNFSETVTLTGTLSIALDSGGVAYVYGPYTGTKFSGTYTVAAGQASSDLNVTSLTLPGGGTLRDAALNPASLTLPVGNNLANNKAIVVVNVSGGDGTVTNLLDSGPGSLRAAIDKANSVPGANNILFDPNLTGTITLTSQLDITEAVQILGPAAAPVTISGNNTVRIFNTFNAPANAVINFTRLTLANGKASFGAALQMGDEIVLLDRCVLTNNAANVNGGAIWMSSGSLTLQNSTVSNNKAVGSSGFGGGGVYGSNGAVTILSSTFSGNSVSGAGNRGGGLFVRSGNGSGAVIRNSTLTGNSAPIGGGIASYFSNAAVVDIQNSTITGNSANSGGGIDNYYFGTIQLASTIVYGNTAATGPDLRANGSVNVTASLVGSKAGTTSFTGDTFTNANIGVNPLLGPLTNNGGPTLTHGFQAGSPALNNGTNVFNESYDQRGIGFPRVVGGKADIGAVEGAVAVLSTVVTNINDSGDGSLRQAIINANNLPGANTVTFDAAFFSTPRTITLTSAEIAITEALTITGPGALLATISGGNALRLFNTSSAQAGAAINFSGLTLTAGKAGVGGALYAEDESIAINSSTISGNSATNGGGIAITYGGTLNLSQSTVSGNTASVLGGGIYLNYGTISGSNAAFTTSSIINNKSGVNGGGLFVLGDAGAAGLKVINSTISGNSATGKGGGIALQRLSNNFQVLNSTVTNNTSGTGSFSGGGGGGIALFEGTGSITVESSIVSNNITAEGGADIHSPNLVNVNYSAVGSNAGFTLTGGNNLPFGTDLKLALLASNGGPTQTHALLAGSPAINKGSNTTGLTTDQRGPGYVRLSGGTTDIGAYEYFFSPLVVLNTNDSGPNSLRDAIAYANSNPGADIITFDPTFFATPRTITLTSGQMVLSDTTGATTLSGPGVSLLTVSGNNLSRVLLINSGVSGAITGMTIANGNSTYGGAVQNSGNVTVSNARFTNNKSDYGGAIFSVGVLSVSNSTFDNNAANFGTGWGGAIINGTTVGAANITGCTFTNNYASLGGALMGYSYNITDSSFANNTAGQNGGAIRTDGIVSVTGSTFSGNSAGNDGGAIMSHGSTTITNSTLANNAAFNGGGVFFFEGAGAMRNLTVAYNTAGNIGGGTRVGTAATVTAVNTIVAGNTAPTGPNAGGSAFASGSSNNLLDVSAAAAGLGTLVNNGGPTQTIALLPGSPAINAGKSLGLTTDQRGAGFNRENSGASDIGAFESKLPPTVTGVVFGDGTNQRSTVRQIVVTFSEPVTFSPTVASAFTLHRAGTGGTIGDVTLTANPASGPASSVTITFSGSLTESGGSLVDGLYDFTISAGQVSGANGLLDGNTDGIAGGSHFVHGTTANRYYRLFGDDNGDGTVNQTDFNAFRLAFLGGPNAEFDFDNDGQVSQPDFNAFRLRFLGSP